MGETQRVPSPVTGAQRRGNGSGRASRAPGGQSTWQGGVWAGEEPPGRAEQVGSQAEAEPAVLPGGSRPGALDIGHGPAHKWGAKELDLAPGGGRHHGGRGPAHGPQLKRETCVARAQGDIHHSCPCAATSVLNFRCGGPDQP